MNDLLFCVRVCSVMNDDWMYRNKKCKLLTLGTVDAISLNEKFDDDL